MNRTITYGVPFVGNDFTVAHAKRTPVAKHVPEPQQVEPDLVAPQPEATNDSNEAPEDKTPRRTRIFNFIVFSLMLVYLVTVGWAFSTNLQRATIPRETKAAEPIRSDVLTVSTADLPVELQKITSQNITFTAGETKVTASSDEIKNWVSTTPVDNDKQMLGINATTLDAYLEQLAAKNTTQPINQVEIKHYDGTTEVTVQGKNGFTVGDTQAAKTQITNNLLSGQGMNIDLPGTAVPFQTTTTKGVNKKLEVNIVTKRMLAYEDGKVVKTFLITAGAPETPTPTGSYKIWQKLKVQDMRGLNADGSKYFQPNVQWVNYFDRSGNAIHGNYWRPASVFGNVNTSHGCVGLTNTDAKWVYDWAPIGTPVDIHK